jgi:signal transduction histidine kinase
MQTIKPLSVPGLIRSRLLRRSLVYGGLTAGVVGVYAATVIVAGTALPGDGPYAVTLLATGVASLVALPLRDRLQRGVSRLFFGDRDEPDRAITRLSRRLEASLEPETVLPMVAETVAQSLRLPYTAIELTRNGETDVVAAHGRPRSELQRLPLVHRGEPIGWLVLAQRAPGEPLSAADRALLTDLARQAGAAAYAVRLTAELHRSRERLVTAQEEERRRLRRELHDGMGPALAGSLMKLEAARNQLSGGDDRAVERLLDELAGDMRDSIERVRRLAYALRPPVLDQLGLRAAVEQEAERLSRPGLSVAVSAPETLTGLSAAVEVAAYHIGLEGLTNIVRHAGAQHGRVELSANDHTLQVEVRDDGSGFQPGMTQGVGLSAMRERAEELGGELELGVAPEGGARITARLPLANPQLRD